MFCFGGFSFKVSCSWHIQLQMLQAQAKNRSACKGIDSRSNSHSDSNGKSKSKSKRNSLSIPSVQPHLHHITVGIVIPPRRLDMANMIRILNAAMELFRPWLDHVILVPMARSLHFEIPPSFLIDALRPDLEALRVRWEYVPMPISRGIRVGKERSRGTTQEWIP